MIQCDYNIIVVSRIQLLVNKNFFHLLFFFDLIVTNRKLTTSENALHFGMKCLKLRRFLGLRPIPHWMSLRRSLRPLVGRGFLPSAIAASRLQRLQFPRIICLYAKNSNISCPESAPPPTPTAPPFFSPPICPTT